MTALDIENHANLDAWLRQSGHVREGDKVRCRTLSGGVSNKTVLVEVGSGSAWVLKQALAKLRVKDDWFSDVGRIRNEARGLRWLEKLAPTGTTTPLIFESETENLLAMQAVPTPHENYKSVLLAGDTSLDQLNDYALQFGVLLGAIQRNARDDSQLPDIFADRSFFETLRLDPYYSTSALREPASARFYHELITDTRATRATLVHGDYSPKNVLIYQGRLILLDHEVIHFGDGAFDVGFAVTHLLSKAHYVEHRRDEYHAMALVFWQAFKGQQPDTDELRCVRHTLGCLLARVLGKSPLEYLTPDQRRRQHKAVVTLMQDPPTTIEALAEQFLEMVE